MSRHSVSAIVFMLTSISYSSTDSGGMLIATPHPHWFDSDRPLKISSSIRSSDEDVKPRN